MDYIEAVVLGVVQGLTEFLPISSSAHVAVVPALLGWDDPGAAFTAVIQLGTLLAVLIYFGKDLAAILSGWLRGLGGGEASKTPEARQGWAVLIGTIPIVILGLLLSDLIHDQFRSLYIMAGTLIGLAIVLWIAERFARRERGIETITIRDGIVVGLWQALALIPGVSRSGSTITGGLFLGLDRPTAARFSFLLSVPAVFLAAVHEVFAQRDALSALGMGPVLVSTAAAFISGYAAIDFLIKFLRNHSTRVFIVYRIVLGMVLIGLLTSGRIQ